MSQSNRDGKRVARERMAAERQRQQLKDRRRRQLSIIAGVVVVILVVVGIGLGVSLSHDGSKGSGDQATGTKGASTPFAAPKGAVVDKYFNESKKPTAIPYGSATAPVTMTVIEDFRCPVCQEFEQTLGSVYSAYVQEGKLRVLYHPVRLIDSNHPGTTGSMLAGSAAACAQDEGKFYQFHTALFAGQPNENSDPWAKPAALLAIAKKVPGLITPAFTQCVNTGKYEGFVQQNWDDFQKFTSNIATPTLLLNGKQLQPSGTTAAQQIQSFENALQNAGAGAPPASLKNAATASPSASASATATPSSGSTPSSTEPTSTPSATNS